MSQRCRTAILISGSGTNLQAFIDATAEDDPDLDIRVVISNNPDAYGLHRAQTAGIEAVCIPHGQFENRETFDIAVIAELERHQPELIILAGFMRILSKHFVEHFDGRILNIHPALLPLYPGLNTHQRVLDAGDTWHGSTVHFVTEQLDAGPRILQGRLRVDASESATDLAQRVQHLEHQIYPQAAALYGSGRLRCREGQCWLDDTPMPEPVIKTFD